MSIVLELLNNMVKFKLRAISTHSRAWCHNCNYLQSPRQSLSSIRNLNAYKEHNIFQAPKAHADPSFVPSSIANIFPKDKIGCPREGTVRKHSRQNQCSAGPEDDWEHPQRETLSICCFTLKKSPQVLRVFCCNIQDFISATGIHLYLHYPRNKSTVVLRISDHKFSAYPSLRQNIMELWACISRMQVNVA